MLNFLKNSNKFLSSPIIVDSQVLYLIYNTKNSGNKYKVDAEKPGQSRHV
jgi:hypothetical protein